MTEITCTICGVAKTASRDFFYKNSNRKSGFDNRCIPCRKIADHSNSVIQSRRRADERRKERDRHKNVARRRAREFYRGKKFNCSVLSCLNDATDLHHINYLNELAVIPLCQRCHAELHANEKKAKMS